MQNYVETIQVTFRWTLTCLMSWCTMFQFRGRCFIYIAWVLSPIQMYIIARFLWMSWELLVSLTHSYIHALNYCIVYSTQNSVHLIDRPPSVLHIPLVQRVRDRWNHWNHELLVKMPLGEETTTHKTVSSIQTWFI